MRSWDRGFGARLFDALNLTLMVLVIVATLYPLYYVAIVSLSDGNAVLRGEVSLYPVGLTLATYGVVFRTATVLQSLWNSVVYAVVGTIINLVLTALCAYPLARPKYSLRKVLTWLIIVTMFFSGGLIPLYLLVLQLDMRNTIWAMVLPTAVNPWYMFIMRTWFQGIPEEIYEAAMVDGANDFQTLFRVILPVAKPILATLLLYYAVAHWNEWFHALLFLDDKIRYPIQLVLRSAVIQGRMEYTGYIASSDEEASVVDQSLRYATIMVATLPILLVYPFVQKYFVQGVLIGSLKG